MSVSLDLGKMLGVSSLVQASWSQRAQIQWARILDKPTDIVLRRQDELLPVQTVRIEWENNIPSNEEDISGVAYMHDVLILGVRGHPEIDDLDIQEWDVFAMDNKKYTVTSVNRHLIGQVQAHCEAI